MPRRTILLPKLAFALLLALPLAGTGCILSVAWLPDSSGFVYTAAGGTRLVRYDLANKKQHVLVENTGAATLCPAVSPNGKRFAVAKLTLDAANKRSALQVILYDQKGKELKRSPAFNWALSGGAVPAKEDAAYLPQLFWAPKGDRILIQTGAYEGVYDVKANRLDHASAGVVLAFGGTPIRPDGAGFLVMKNVRWPQWWDRQDNTIDPNPGFAFVHWDGKEEALKPPPFLMDRAALKREKDGNKLGGLLFPGVYNSAWHDDVAQVSWNTDRLRYLTKKGQAVLAKIKPDLTADGLLIKQRYDFPGGKVHVRAVVTRWQADRPEQQVPLRVEIVRAGRKAPEVLLKDVELCVLVPSPNRKLVALRCLGRTRGPRQPGEDTIIVVNDRGEVAARIRVNP
jgi:hypothetical protein